VKSYVILKLKKHLFFYRQVLVYFIIVYTMFAIDSIPTNRY